MKIRVAALAGWDSADEHARTAVIEHAIKRATAAYDDEHHQGMASAFRSPTLEVVGIVTSSPLVAIVATTCRVYHYAQSGSDWSTQSFVIAEASFTGGVTERVLYQTSRDITEGNSDAHDDEAEAREVIDTWLATEAAIKRADDIRDRESVEGVRAASTVRVLDRRARTVVTTATSSYLAHAVETTHVVVIEETEVTPEELVVRTVLERNFSAAAHEDQRRQIAQVVDEWKRLRR